MSHQPNKPQRQDSLYHQLKDLIPIANREGCYDAADYLRRVIEDIEEKLKRSNAPYSQGRK